LPLHCKFMNYRLFVATKAFIIFRGKVLILRESTKYQDGANWGRYDVPGGRIKPGQKFDQSLKREVKEETNLKIKILKPFFVSEWRPKVKGENWQIIGVFFICQAMTDKVKLSKDHNHFLWIKPKDYKKYNLIPNLIKIFKAYLE